MVLGIYEHAVRDGINVLSSDDFDACLAIATIVWILNFMRTCRRRQVITKVMSVGSGTAVEAPVLRRPAYKIKPVSRIHRVPEELIGPDSPEGIAVSHRVSIVHYLLDMG